METDTVPGSLPVGDPEFSVPLTVFSLVDTLVISLLMFLFLSWSRERRCREFCDACRDGHFTTVNNIMDQTGFIRNFLFGLSSEQHSMGLMWACSSGHAHIVERIIQSPDLFDHRFSTASCLMCASKRGHVACVRLLLANPLVSIDCVNPQGLTAEQVTKNPLVKDLIRQEHWRRVKGQIKDIQDTVGFGVERLDNTFNEVGDDKARKKEILKKNKALLQKIDVIESKEAKEYEQLEMKIQAEQRAIKEKYSLESLEFRKDVNKEICELKALLCNLKTTPENNLEKESSKSVQCWSELFCTECNKEMRPPIRIWTCGSNHYSCDICKGSGSKCFDCGDLIRQRCTLAEKLARTVFS